MMTSTSFSRRPARPTDQEAARPGARRWLGPILALILGLAFLAPAWRAAAAPPVVRSTSYNGAYSNIVHYPVQPWMNTNTVLMTVEAWVFANDLNGFQALVARHFTTNLWFGLNGSRVRFYRSGGTVADSDGTLVVGRWTHVAVTYDGANARFYLDGVAAGVKPLASAGNNSTNGLSLGGQRDLVLGSDSGAAGYAFNGFLDEVRIWSVVRSQSAIAASMNAELRSGNGLLAAFGSGGDREDLSGAAGNTQGIPVASRESGFGILPSSLCIPWTSTSVALDGNVNLVTEYRGAETLVLRASSAAGRDRAAYLLVVTNATTHHLYVAAPDLDQSGAPQIPTVQVQADVNPFNGTGLGLGDWECRLEQDGLQGGRIYGVNPPFFPDPTWLSWGQSVSNWQAATASPFEFLQTYEFRIHARHLNYFSNAVGLLVRYYGYSAAGDQLVGPRGALPDQPATYIAANWCGRADAPTSLINVAGSVTNLNGNLGAAGRPVALYSGDSELTGVLIATTTTGADGRFTFSGVSVPSDRRVTVTWGPPTSVDLLTPAIDFAYSVTRPVSTNSPLSITYPPCAGLCSFGRVNFRYRSLGPVGVTGVIPATVPAPVIVRTSPLKVTGGGMLTVQGSNFHSGVQVYLRGAGCTLIPPNFCTSDFTELEDVIVAPDGRSLSAPVPTGLAGVATAARSFQIVVGNPIFASTGGERWVYGPSVGLTPPAFPLLHGFEFVNRDDGPSVDEFEACYGDSIFNVFRIREPYYGIWAAVYMAWMDGCKGSCYGMAGTSRLMSDSYLPPSTYDVPGGDGVHGVRYANGYLGVTPCEVGGELCPPKPGRYTGFDLFQPYRPLNLWSRISSLAGAQTSAEALGFWLGQLGRPVAVGPRRGLAAGDPVDVLNRIRTSPYGYTVCVYSRDFGGGHCITPYAVRDGFRLDAATASIPEPAANFSLILVYDNNWPGQERFIEVNRVDNTFRYNGATSVGIYEGPGLFYVPASVYRNARHAPDPFFLGRYGLEFLRILVVGSSASSLTDASGGRVGWGAGAITNGYEGALTYVPPAALRDGVSPVDTTMLFLPHTNAPVRGGFFSKGSDVLLHAAMGWGDIAFGFNAANAGASNSVDGILIGLNQGLVGLGLKAGAPVTGFSAMVGSRDDLGQSRVLVLDAGGGPVTPDLRVERDGFKSVTLRNRSAVPLAFRLNFAGTDRATGTFEQAYDAFPVPALGSVVLRLPENPSARTVVREVDLNGDGVPETVEEMAANARLRIGNEAGLLAIRWREAGFGGVLETASAVAPQQWAAAGAVVSTEGGDRVARVKPEGAAGFYRLRLDGTNCLSLAGFPVGPRPNPWETNGFKFEAYSAAGAPLAQNTIVSRGGFTGLDVQHTVRVHPPAGSDAVHLEIYQTSGLVTFEAVGPLGTVVGRATLTGSGTVLGLQRVTLRGFRGGIHFVRVVSPNALCLIANVCAERAQMPQSSVTTACLSFSNAAPGQFQGSLTLDGVTITSTPGPTAIGPVGGLGGNWLKLAGTVKLEWATACDTVRLRVADFEGVVIARAYDASGALVSTAGPPPGSTAPQELFLTGGRIVRVEIVSTSDKAWLQEICCSRRTTP